MSDSTPGAVNDGAGVLAFFRVTDGEIVQSYVIASPSGSEDPKPFR